jgi:SpoIID/LytB domain protein
VGTIRRLEVLKRGVSGRAIALRVVGKEGSLILEPELRIRRALGNLPSSLFVLQQKHSKRGLLERAVFEGRGWGHGVGMCQMGAIGMAEAGYDAGRILKHYYPGSALQTVY